jgi:hypothetical protein
VLWRTSWEISWISITTIGLRKLLWCGEWQEFWFFFIRFVACCLVSNLVKKSQFWYELHHNQDQSILRSFCKAEDISCFAEGHSLARMNSVFVLKYHAIRPAWQKIRIKIDMLLWRLNHIHAYTGLIISSIFAGVEWLLTSRAASSRGGTTRER